MPTHALGEMVDFDCSTRDFYPIPWDVYLGSILLSGLAFMVLNRLGLSKTLFGQVYKRLSSAERIEYDSRVISNIHALIAVYGGYLTFTLEDDSVMTPINAALSSSPRRQAALTITAGYIAYDLILCLIYKDAIGDVMTLVHHTVIMCGFVFAVGLNVGTIYASAFLLNEVSTIFVNQNFFMATNPESKGGLWYKLNGVALMVTFFIFRVLLNSYVVYHIITEPWLKAWADYSPYCPLHLRLTCYVLTFLAFGHLLVNLVWFANIVAAVKRKLFGSSKSKKSKTA